MAYCRLSVSGDNQKRGVGNERSGREKEWAFSLFLADRLDELINIPTRRKKDM